MTGRVWTRVSRVFACLSLLAVSCSDGPRNPQAPEGYPGDYGKTITAAERGTSVTVWSSTDRAQVADLLSGFRKRYPRVAVDYREMRATNIYNWFVTNRWAGKPAPDVIWSSAMDLQIKLVNDGHAQSYVSPEREAIAPWANWKDQAWGITAEPIVMIYNRRLMEPAAAPKSHLEFRRLLETNLPAYDGRITTYDPAQSAFGYLILAQDNLASRGIWRTVRALGANHARLFPTTKAIIDDVASGRSLIGYNVLGSYAAAAARRAPDLAVVVPRDYTLVASRIAIISADAPHPAAARLFLDYLLSREGQRALVGRAMPSVRSDMPEPADLARHAGPIRAIRVGPALLVMQDTLSRQHFMRQWDTAIATGRTNGPDRFGL